MDFEEEKKITPDLDLVSISKIIRENNRIRRNKLKKERNLINHQNDQYNYGNEIYNFDNIFLKIDQNSDSLNTSLNNNNERKSTNGIKINNSILFNTDKKNKQDKRLIRSSTFDSCAKYPQNQDLFNDKNWKYKRIPWVIFLIMSTSLCSYMIVKTLIDYTGYEVITKIRVFNDKPALFPAITICNKNPFVTENGTKFLSLFQVSPHRNSSPNEDEVLFTNLLEAALNAKNPGFSDELKKSFGYPIEDMLIKCHFTEIRCSANDFYWYYDFNYGNCYTFNSGYNATGHRVPIRTVQKPGRFAGLYLQLFIGRPQSVYLSEFTSGIHLLISNQSVPLSLSEGINAKPGTITNVDIKKVFTNRLPEPYSECKDLNKFNSTLFDEIQKSNHKYRQKDCFDLCLQKIVIEKCNCYDLQFPKLFNSTPCLSKTEMNCSEHLSSEFLYYDLNKMCSSQCPLECDSITYDLSTSTANYPTRMYSKLLKKQSKITRYFKNEEVTFDKLKESLVALDINYAELKYTYISESASKTIIDLIASIGGTIGLFLGTSLLSAVEIVEHAFKIFVIFKNKRKAKSKNIKIDDTKL